MKFSAYDFNFFDKYNKTRRRAQRRVELIAALVSVVFFVAFCCISVSYAIRITMQGLENKINSHTLYLENPATIRKLIEYEEATERLSAITLYNDEIESMHEALKKTDVVNTFLMQAVSDNIPTDTSISSMTVSAGSIEIVGVSGKETSVAQFERNMSGLQFVNTVHVAGITNNENGCNFAMSISLKDVASFESIGHE